MRDKHILKNMIPEGEAFIACIPSLIVDLAQMLGLPPESIDYGIDGLTQIERTIRCKYSPKRRADPAILLPLLTYVSEVGRRAVNGQWDVRLADDGITWEPWIVDPKGQSYEFFTATFKEFCDLDDSTASIVGALYGRIRSSALDGLVKMADLSKKEKGKEKGDIVDLS